MSAPLPVALWNLWLRTYGPHDAIRLALSHRFTRQDIRRANAAALADARKAVT